MAMTKYVKSRLYGSCDFEWWHIYANVCSLVSRVNTNSRYQRRTASFASVLFTVWTLAWLVIHLWNLNPFKCIWIFSCFSLYAVISLAPVRCSSSPIWIKLCSPELVPDFPSTLLLAQLLFNKLTTSLYPRKWKNVSNC